VACWKLGTYKNINIRLPSLLFIYLLYLLLDLDLGASSDMTAKKFNIDVL
jgi:hypothetical protein